MNWATIFIVLLITYLAWSRWWWKMYALSWMQEYNRLMDAYEELVDN